MSVSRLLIFLIAAFLTTGCQVIGDRKILPVIPKGAEALTITGEELFPTEPSASATERLRTARDEWKKDRSDPDLLIWYGRWTAYCGRFRDAIRIYSEGIRTFPDDARILRHRGHRYISIREFGRAIDDLEKAALLVAFTPDEVEPDGMPNAMNIPVGTLHSNIYYHLGLARYLAGDREKALDAWMKDAALNINDDMKVATLHWIYTTLSDLGRNEEALEVLSDVTHDMHIIENQAYHKLCLFYKGEIGIDDMHGEEHSSIMDDAMLYGIGNWYLNNGEAAKASDYFSRIFTRGSWASFGYIAAEARVASLQTAGG